MAAQIAWPEKASSDVRNAAKPDTALVHWFDNWGEISKTPAKYGDHLFPSSRLPFMLPSLPPYLPARV